MLNLGCHLSISKGFLNIGKEAASIKANTFQFFTRNPQGGKAKDLDLEEQWMRICSSFSELELNPLNHVN